MRNNNKRVYRSPAAPKLRETLKSQSQEKIDERNKIREKERERCMQEHLDSMKNNQKDSKNPNDDMFFKAAESMMFF